jgi:hypothetical protein
MAETYSTVTWTNDAGERINATNLNRMESGIESMDDRTAALEVGMQAPVTLTASGGSITPNAAQGSLFRHVATADVTLAAPINGADGQVITVQVQASGGARNLTVGSSAPVNISSGGWWNGELRYHQGSDTWVLVAGGGGESASGSLGLADDHTWPGTQRFVSTFGGGQSTASGTYPTSGGGNPGIEFATGTSNWRIDNSGGTLRFLQAGIKTVTSLDFTGRLATRLVECDLMAVGSNTSPRHLMPIGLTMDGSTFTGATPNADKVAQPLAVTFKGGFANEVALGQVNPGWLWGANDFVVTGTASGDLAGIEDLMSRLTEVHCYAPGAALNTLTGLQCEAAMDSPGGTAVNVYALRVIGSRIRNGTVTNAYGAYITEPSLDGGSVTGIRRSLHVDGSTLFNGTTAVNGSFTVSATSGSSLYTRFTTDTPNNQGVPLGVYPGQAGDPGVDISDGTRTGRVDVSGTKLRFLKAGVHVLGEWDLDSRNFDVKAGLSLSGIASNTSATAGAASALPSVPVGYITVSINGTNRKIPYYAT